MRVDYKVGFYQYKSEWICFEHTGWARQRAEAWWRARSHDPLPMNSQQAVDIANAGGVASTRKITVRSVSGEKFDRIVDYELGEKPDALPVEAYASTESSDIPF
jgi:DNA repair protein RadD